MERCQGELTYSCFLNGFNTIDKNSFTHTQSRFRLGEHLLSSESTTCGLQGEVPPQQGRESLRSPQGIFKGLAYFPAATSPGQPVLRGPQSREGKSPCAHRGSGHEMHSTALCSYSHFAGLNRVTSVEYVI